MQINNIIINGGLQNDRTDELHNLIVDSRFVHLATCSLQNIPNIALMHYLYVKTDNNNLTNNNNDFIILSLGKDTETYQNLIENSIVSLLFHNWVYISPLQLLNTKANSNNNNDNLQYSSMIRGDVEIYEQFTKEFKHWRSKLLKSNPDGDTFILQDDNVIIKINCQYLKLTDINNNIKVFN